MCSSHILKRASNFLTLRTLIIEDLSFAAQALGLKISEVDIQTYCTTKTPLNHQSRIAGLLGYQLYNNEAKEYLVKEIKDHVKRQVSPQKIFLLLLKCLQARRITFPTYHALSTLIGDVLYNQEKSFVNVVKSTLSETEKSTLTKLLVTDQKTKHTPIREFKIINQAVKPKAIKASIGIYTRIKNHFDIVEPTLNSLSLHKDCIQYYATWVRKAKLSQLQQFPDKINATSNQMH